MICQLDPNGFCNRHRRVHQKCELALALDPGAKGEKYRKLWDEWGKLTPTTKEEREAAAAVDSGNANAYKAATVLVE